MKKMKERIVIAISGGVDSSTSAFLLQEAGYEVIGVFMRLGTDSYEDELSARKVCQELGIRFYPVNFKSIFQKQVVDYFVESYKSGITPNPCVRCNRLIKFGELLKVAESLDAKLATGHYVRVEKRGGVYHLYRGFDANKDQSYFLYNLGQYELSRIIFPLAKLEKVAIKKLASEKKLSHKIGESQDICFLNQAGAIIDHNEFLEKRLDLQPGPIKTKDNKVIGEHRGLPLYTVGQRRGVEIGGIGPFYVLSMDYATNTLYVTNNPADVDMFAGLLVATNVKWVSGVKPVFPHKCQAVIRYRHEGEDCIVTEENGKIKVEFSNPQRAVTAGQSVVFYHGDEVIGGGIIQ